MWVEDKLFTEARISGLGGFSEVALQYVMNLAKEVSTHHAVLNTSLQM